MSHDLQDCTVILLYMIYNSYFDPVNQIGLLFVILGLSRNPEFVNFPENDVMVGSSDAC